MATKPTIRITPAHQPKPPRYPPGYFGGDRFRAAMQADIAEALALRERQARQAQAAEKAR
jgi:hypothetical protein